jgi:integrase
MNALAPIPGAELQRADRDPVAVYVAGLGSAKSQRTMAAALTTIAAELGVASAHLIPWEELRYQHVAALRARLVKRFAPATVNKLLSAVRGAAREAMRLGLLQPEEHARIVDVAGVRGSRLPAGRHVEEGELASLVGACERKRDGALLALLCVTGMRRSELVALDLEHVDEATCTIRILGKGNKERLAYAAEARAEIAGWLEVRGRQPGPLLCSINKAGTLRRRRLAESSVNFILARIAARAGVDGLAPHDVRRTWVGRLLDAGADISAVQRLAGHSRVDTTQRYDRRGERAAEAAAGLVRLPRRREDNCPE